MALNYKQDIQIDEDNLDLEWLNHPRLYMEYCRESAEANKAAKAAAQRVKTEYARLVMTADAALSVQGIKATETTRDSYVLTHPDYAQAVQDKLNREYEADLLSSAVDAFGHRKTALQELCGLNARDYFASPRTPRDINPEYKEQWERKKNENKDEAAAVTSSSIRDRLNDRLSTRSSRTTTD